MRRKTTEDFIKEAVAIYGSEHYDYSLTVYIRRDQNVQIKCNYHNVIFEQTPGNHLYRFEGCPECYAQKQRKIFTKTTEQFIKDAIKVHGDKYDYSETIYQNIHIPVEIICRQHGKFTQYPTNHLRGCDCLQCGYAKIPGGFLDASFEQYPEKKNIPATLYLNRFTRVDGSYFFKLGISTKVKYRYSSQKYNHFKIDEVWTKDLTLYQARRYEILLGKIFREYNINVPESFHGKSECYSMEIPKPQFFIDVFEHEWKPKKDIILSRFNVKNHLNPKLITKIYARNTEIAPVSELDTKEFLKENHIQGEVNGSVSLGLFLSGNLCSLMTFGKPRYNKEYQWELLRFTSRLNTIVIGGASKLFKQFIRNFDPTNIISYSDARWNNGEIYKIIGMSFSHRSKPNYWYIKGDKVKSRVLCQKHKLAAILDTFDPDKTELQNMQDNGYSKITDDGNDVYIWHKKSTLYTS